MHHGQSFLLFQSCLSSLKLCSDFAIFWNLFTMPPRKSSASAKSKASNGRGRGRPPNKSKVKSAAFIDDEADDSL